MMVFNKLMLFSLLAVLLFANSEAFSSNIIKTSNAGAGLADATTVQNRCDFQIGWTQGVRGGLDGEVVRVTNLNRSGPGSLAAAIKMKKPRLVVFEVGGVIDLGTSTLKIKHPHITIAGQTAPFPGITLIRGNLRVKNTHDVVLQHLRIRPGTAEQKIGWEPDGLTIWDSKRVIVDHLSVSWGVDENLSVSGTKREGSTQKEWRENASSEVTIINSIIAEGLHYATHKKTPHSKGSLISDYSTNIFIYNNLYASNHMRNPRFARSSKGAIVNNYIANPGEKVIQAWQLKELPNGEEPETLQLSIVGNYVQGGKDTVSDIALLESTDNVQTYFYDNILLNLDGSEIPMLRRWKKTDRFITDIIGQAVLWPDNFSATSGISVAQNIWTAVGARPNERDSIDQRIIEQAKNNTGRIINHEKDVGGYPEYEMTTAVFNPGDWNACMEAVVH